MILSISIFSMFLWSIAMILTGMGISAIIVWFLVYFDVLEVGDKV